MATAAAAKAARPRKDTEEVVSGVARQIKALEARGANEDPWVVAEMLRLAGVLVEAAGRTVARQRAVGYTWKDIGFDLGLTPMATFKRYDRYVQQANLAAAHKAVRYQLAARLAKGGR